MSFLPRQVHPLHHHLPSLENCLHRCRRKRVASTVLVNSLVGLRHLSAKNGAVTLKSLPYVHTIEELYQMKLWRKRARENPTIKSSVKRSREMALAQVRLIAGGFVSLVKETYKGFPPLGRFHPFEKTVLQLTLQGGEGEYYKCVEQLDIVRKRLHMTERNFTGRAVAVSNKKEVEELTDELVVELRKVLEESKKELDVVQAMAKTLRGLPHFDLHRPVVGLAGAPNVGKSSLVRAMSSGVPEVANYPFTTRGITMGHVKLDNETFQMADLPGLLTRTDSERNRIEMLALAVMQYTEAAVLFVIDLTGHSGATVESQVALREELRSRFPEKAKTAWLDIVSKVDLITEGDLDRHNWAIPQGSHLVSTHTGQGLDKLGAAIIELIESNWARSDLIGDISSSTPASISRQATT